MVIKEQTFTEIFEKQCRKFPSRITRPMTKEELAALLDTKFQIDLIAQKFKGIQEIYNLERKRILDDIRTAKEIRKKYRKKEID